MDDELKGLAAELAAEVEAELAMAMDELSMEIELIEAELTYGASS